MKAYWNNTLIAQSEETIVIENNHYFPPSALNMQFFEKSNTQSTCPWKGLASYYSLQVDGQTNTDAAWYYPAPKEAAAQIKDYVAFWKGVQITS